MYRLDAAAALVEQQVFEVLDTIVKAGQLARGAARVDGIGVEEQMGRVRSSLGRSEACRASSVASSCNPNSSPIMSKSACVGPHRSSQSRYGRVTYGLLVVHLDGRCGVSQPSA